MSSRDAGRAGSPPRTRGPPSRGATRATGRRRRTASARRARARRSSPPRGTSGRARRGSRRRRATSSSRSSHSRLSTSRWFVGSSSSSRSGSAESARASEARVSSPPENVSSGRSRSASREPEAADDRRRAVAPGPAARVLEAAPGPRCSGAASPARGRRPPSPARAGASSSSIATRSPAPESAYSRRVRPCPRGGRWSWSATRVSFANASSPPWSEVSPMIARRSVVLPGAVRAREREPVAAAQPERDPVEEGVAGELLAQPGCDQHGHALKGADECARA